MASFQTTSNDSSSANDKGVKGSVEGRVYEKLSLLLLAKNGYVLSKDNAKFRDFSIGREIGIGREVKFDDNVFRYTEDDSTKSFICVQVKHIQRDHQIDSRDLSMEAARARRGRGGGKSREFNLQKYFLSYLSVREELKGATAEEFTNGAIKYVAIFTNAGLDKEELIRKGFSSKKAPDDIVKLFTLKTQEPKDFYQLCNISEELHKIFMKSSDLHRLAKEISQYLVWETHRQKNIMKNDTSPMKNYHVPLAREVIQKSDRVENNRKQNKTEQYSEAQFRDDFLDNDETGSKQELRNAIFEAVRELDGSKKPFSDDHLKNILKGIKWKIIPKFGEIEENEEINLPPEWKVINEEDITDFLKCLVLIVNQPRLEDLQDLILGSVQDTMVDRHYNTSLRKIVHKLDKTFPELKEHVEQDLGIYETTNFQEGWTSGEQIVKLLDTQKQQISLSFYVTAMTLIYESEVMQLGKFNESEKMGSCLDNFFSSSAQILCVNTSQTLLSSIKILQYLNSKKDYIAEDGRIYTNSDILSSKENRHSVASAFELERNVLLVIEYRHTVNEQDLEEIYNKWYSSVDNKPNKKIILIIPQEEHNDLLYKFKNNSQNKNCFILEDDVIDIRYFEPKKDPFKKKVIVFQGQDERVSLSDITRIDSWNYYVQSLAQETHEERIINGVTLVKILSNDEIEVGSTPAGTSSLEGAYAQMYEEINVETLVNKVILQEQDNGTNDMYIISGITGSNEQDKTYKLIQNLGRNIENAELKKGLEEFKNRLKTNSFKNLQVFDDKFKDKNFQEMCHRYQGKRIFWICLKGEKKAPKFMLHEIYNPKFYLERKLKNVNIKKDLKEHLIKEDLSEIFIFYCSEGKKELYDFMELNAREIEQFENSGMIKIRFQKVDAEKDFDFFKKKETAHLLEFEKKQFVWCESQGSMKTLQRYIDQELCEASLVEEDNFIRKIKDRKVVIFADDPGMGKTTTLTKLYEKEIESSSIIKSHWVIGIKLRDHLEAVRDLENDISIVSVVHFLSKIDQKLNNNLAENVLKNALDISENFRAKPLLLVFDGFDEVLDEDDRNGILLLLKFIKNKTEAKLWVTTRRHFKTLLEEELSTIAFEFNPMDDIQKAQYITTYLKHRLYLILNQETYAELFDNFYERQNSATIHKYTVAFINKMKSIFRGDIATFIGTPLQMYLMLEGAIRDFKNWIEEGGCEIPDLKYIRSDVCEVYENFIKRKYDVYFQKRGSRERVQERLEKHNIDRYHKDLAVSKILEVNPEDDFEQCKDIFLLVGVIKSQGNDLEFIHKTFEEFFASKAFIDWIKKAPKTDKQEYLLKDILLKRDYQLVRTFINLQLQKLSEHSWEDERQKELDKSLEQYGTVAVKLLNEQNSPLIDVVIGTPLHIAVKENNKNIAFFLLNSLKRHPDALRKFLFAAGEYRGRDNAKRKGTALHLACTKYDVEIVRALLDTAEGISEDALEEFLKCLNDKYENLLLITAIHRRNVHIFHELLSRASSKLDFILTEGHSALCQACLRNKKEFVDLLLQEFDHEKHSLKIFLLYTYITRNALCYAGRVDIIEKLISAAKSIEDNNETLKNMLLPYRGKPPLNDAAYDGKIIKVEKLLIIAKEIDDDYHTLKQLLLKKRYGNSALHEAAKSGHGDIIKLLLETTSNLGMEILEKLITDVDARGRNAIQIMFEYGHEAIFTESFKIYEVEKYSNIWEKVMEMLDSVPLERRLWPVKENLITAIQDGNIKEVKSILSNAKNSSVSPNESFRILLLDEYVSDYSIFDIACERGTGNSEIIKELLSNAINMDDGGATLKELLENINSSLLSFTDLREFKHGCRREIKQIVESFIFEAEINNRMRAVNILKEFKEQLTKGQPL